jgi:Cof subfamily protein (haloacid dehalogenase superfamily)
VIGLRPPACGLPRLVAIDLDGTLLRSDKTVSPRTEQALAALRQRGVRVVICTGRPPRSTKAIAQQLGLDSCVIVYGGAAIFDFERDVALARFDMSARTARGVLNALRAAFPQVMLGLETHHGFYLDSAYYASRDGSSEPDGVHDDVGTFIQDTVTKVLVRDGSQDARTLARTLADLPVHCTWSFHDLLEVTAAEVSKRRALQCLSEQLGIPPNQVAAFGDEHNDREMLAWAGRGVAMGNAAPDIKALADVVTCSNDEDGVAEVIEAWLAGC